MQSLLLIKMPSYLSMLIKYRYSPQNFPSTKEFPCLE